MIKGSCHCGAIKYTLDDSPTQAIRCNCTICRRKACILAFSSPDRLALDADASVIAEYTFGEENIRHQFCAKCGCSPLGRGIGPDGNEMVGINLNCTEGFDLSTVSIEDFDGASL
ncbi:GFA family protein [Exilibacterium tricleocarpae]|uniref:GFA family protein n=1 Tax=Exilibacterium tricleocarpae TaxID=2591008 RepID=A0A545TLG4_9GAMM|nr:GFA family protein [Exilibacterium tricleocarpae]TQV78059.1 GFA family protein [Exilibacterium tricleocarpae]